MTLKMVKYACYSKHHGPCYLCGHAITSAKEHYYTGHNNMHMHKACGIVAAMAVKTDG